MAAPLASRKTLALTQFALLLAIEAIFCFTPLGSLPIGPIVATLAMIPVIITAILLGTAAGTAMGAFAGLFSLLVWTFVPPQPIIAFVFSPFYRVGAVKGNFWSLVICFIPRILAGTVTGACYHLSKRFQRRSGIAYGLSGVLGSLTNTFLVLGGIYVFFGRSYASVLGKTTAMLFALIGTTILTNGVLEAVIGGVAAYAVCRPIQNRLEHNTH